MAISENRFDWFKQYMIEGYSYREISQMKKVSLSTVKRVIKYWLESPPEEKKDYQDVKHIICDGTLIKRVSGVYALMNAEDRKLVNAEYGVKETSKKLFEFYEELKGRGLNPLTATVDGSPQQIKYLRETWPEITIQRCVVHVQRQGLSWCRMQPKRTEAKFLREIFLQLCFVKTKLQAENFIKLVNKWEDEFGTQISTSTNRGRVFSDLIRARSMLLKALPNLFHYVSNPKIPRSTNAIEGYFSRMKEIYRLHRGLSIESRKNYFKWFFFLKPF